MHTDASPALLPGALPNIPLRNGRLLVSQLIDLYMAHYTGLDVTRGQRLRWWQSKLGELHIADVNDDQIFAALEDLALQSATYFAGYDASGKAIYKSKHKPLSPATINRYSASVAAVFTWAIKRRIAPAGWTHPCRAVERRPESSGKTRFLSDAERASLLIACQASTWPRLYLLVLLALTTGARKSELTGLKWSDIDFAHSTAVVGRSKNGDPKSLPIVEKALIQLSHFKGAPSAYVFPSRRSNEKPCSFEPQWEIALKKARVKNFRFHDLRHSCASMLAQNGATLLEIGDLLGHRQLQMTKRYSHLTTAHKSALVNRVLANLC